MVEGGLQAHHNHIPQGTWDFVVHVHPSRVHGICTLEYPQSFNGYSLVSEHIMVQVNVTTCVFCYRELEMNLPLPEESPPAPWWNAECDYSLLVGIVKHGGCQLDSRDYMQLVSLYNVYLGYTSSMPCPIHMHQTIGSHNCCLKEYFCLYSFPNKYATYNVLSYTPT